MICIVCGQTDDGLGRQIVDLLALQKLKASVAGNLAARTRQVAVWLVTQNSADDLVFITALRTRVDARLPTIILIFDESVAAETFPTELTITLTKASLIDDASPEVRPLLNRCRMMAYAVPSQRPLGLDEMTAIRRGVHARAVGRPGGPLGAPLPPTRPQPTEDRATESTGGEFSNWSPDVSPSGRQPQSDFLDWWADSPFSGAERRSPASAPSPPRPAAAPPQADFSDGWADIPSAAAEHPLPTSAAPAPEQERVAAPEPPPIPISPPARGSHQSRSLWRLCLLGATIVGGGLLYAFREEVLAGGAALFNLVVGTLPPPGAVQAAGHTYVDASAFGPKRVPLGQEFLVQVFLHAAEDEVRASSLAREADPEAERRGLTTLSIEIPHRTRVGVVLETPGLMIEEPTQSLLWMGEPRSCQFAVTVPFDFAKASANARVRLLIDDIPVGSLRFTIAIAPTEDSLPATDKFEGHARRYRHVFLSYASPDRAEVLKRAQALQAAGISFFQDLLALEPGERWERRLYEEIDRSDLFLLFWSAHAAVSPWVGREIEHALARADASGTERPDIMPIVLDLPPMTPPPPSLQHIHFGDRVHHIMGRW